MTFAIRLTRKASKRLAKLEADKGTAVQAAAVRKALAQLEADPNHPSLNVHPWRSETCPHKKTLFEAYAQNRTPGAYRIFFCYCAVDDDKEKRGWIQVIAITPHP